MGPEISENAFTRFILKLSDVREVHNLHKVSIRLLIPIAKFCAGRWGSAVGFSESTPGLRNVESTEISCTS